MDLPERFFTLLYQRFDLWYHSSYHSQNHIWYNIWYHRNNINMISYISIWYHSPNHIYDIIVLLSYHNREWYHMVWLWYQTSYHEKYHIWYHRYDIDYEIMVYEIIVNIISMKSLWNHSQYHIYDIIVHNFPMIS